MTTVPVPILNNDSFSLSNKQNEDDDIEIKTQNNGLEEIIPKIKLLTSNKTPQLNSSISSYKNLGNLSEIQEEMSSIKSFKIARKRHDLKYNEILKSPDRIQVIVSYI